MAMVAFATVFLTADRASGDLVGIVNPSFEANALNNGNFIRSAFGWNAPGDSGTHNPRSTDYFSEAPDGLNVAFSSISGPTLSQVLAENLEANTVYTLTMQVGNRTQWTFPGYRIDLLAGNTILASDVNSITPVNGEFQLATVSYSSSSTDAMLGEALQIRFRAFGAQAGFDDVRLDATASVPEPTSLCIVLLSTVSVASCRRRRSA